MNTSIRTFGMAVLVAIGMASCGEQTQTDKSAETTQQQEQKRKEATSYLVHTDKSKLAWKAYKFTKKVGVGGHFDNIQSRGAHQAESPAASLKGVQFRVETASINSNAPDRDKKIQDYFFASMVDTDYITGEFIDYEGKESGVFTISVKMNGIERKAYLDYVQQSDELVLKGDINLDEWNAGKAVAALNEKCKQLHTGADGISKLWPTVSLHLNIPYSGK